MTRDTSYKGLIKSFILQKPVNEVLNLTLTRHAWSVIIMESILLVTHTGGDTVWL